MQTAPVRPLIPVQPGPVPALADLGEVPKRAVFDLWEGEASLTDGRTPAAAETAPPVPLLPLAVQPVPLGLGDPAAAAPAPPDVPPSPVAVTADLTGSVDPGTILREAARAGAMPFTPAERAEAAAPGQAETDLPRQVTRPKAAGDKVPLPGPALAPGPVLADGVTPATGQPDWALPATPSAAPVALPTALPAAPVAKAAVAPTPAPVPPLHSKTGPSAAPPVNDAPILPLAEAKIPDAPDAASLATAPGFRPSAPILPTVANGATQEAKVSEGTAPEGPAQPLADVAPEPAQPDEPPPQVPPSPRSTLIEAALRDRMGGLADTGPAPRASAPAPEAAAPAAAVPLGTPAAKVADPGPALALGSQGLAVPATAHRPRPTEGTPVAGPRATADPAHVPMAAPPAPTLAPRGLSLIPTPAAPVDMIPSAFGAWTETPEAAALGLTSLPMPTGGAPAPGLPPAGVAHLAGRLVDMVVQRSDGVTEVALAPDELGKVQVSVQTDAQNPERVVLFLSFDRPETLDLFRRHIDLLTEAMRDAGYTQADIGFGFADQGTGGQADRAPESGPPETATVPGADRPSAPTADPAPLRTAAAGSGLDMRL